MTKTPLLSTRIICMICIKKLKNTTQIKKRKILTVFDHMIPDMENNEKLHEILNELFVRRRKLNISFLFITPS